jgi:hypothetical protein
LNITAAVNIDDVPDEIDFGDAEVEVEVVDVQSSTAVSGKSLGL